MKKTIKTVREGLIYQLQGLHFAETKLSEQFQSCKGEITSSILKEAIESYMISGSKERVLKLERIFNHLVHEPITRNDKVILKLIEEAHNFISFTTSPYLKDIMVLSCIQKINAIKISVLKTAHLFALEEEMNETADLIHQIMEWERATEDTLDKLISTEFNISHEVDKYNLSI